MNRLWVRLTLAFVAVTLIAVIALAWLTNSSADTEFRQYLYRQDMMTQMGLFDELAAFYQRNGNWNGVEQILSTYAMPMMGGRGTSAGAGRGRPPIGLADSQAVVLYDERNLALGATLSADERNAAQAITVNGATVGYVMLGQGARATLTSVDQAFLDQLRTTMVLAGAAAIILGIFLSLLISRTIAAPLANVAQAARAFAARDWNQRATVQGADEVAEVAREFNQMADELQRAEILRRDMMADIAHELRTPLTVLQGNLSALIDGVYPLERGEIATLYDETRVLSRLVEDLRELALADAGQLQLAERLQSVDVGKVLQDTMTNFAVAADAQQIHLTVETGEAMMVQADPDRFAQILRNLVANALRHTPPNGSIHLAAQTIDQMIQVSVIDTGEGIAPQDLPRVFERFYRGDKSRARTSGGTGLGLAIAKAWVQVMGGKLGVESKLGQGSRFWFTLPRK